jgi:hypothetical protein
MGGNVRLIKHSKTIRHHKPFKDRKPLSFAFIME